MVVDQPVGDVELNVARTGDQLTISWTGSGFTLQSSDNLTTWSNVAGVTGTSYTTTTSAPARFYQLVSTP